MLIPSPAGPDKDAIFAFIADTIQNNIHLVAIALDGPATGRWFGDNAKAATEWAFSANAHGANCYWTVNICRPGVNTKPKKSDIVATRFLHLDIDPPKDASAFDKGAIAQNLLAATASPTVAIDSGGGLQAFWRHDGEARPDQIEALNRALSAQFCGDAVANIDRLMRLPGTVNYPNAKKCARGRLPALARVIQPDTGEIHSIEKLSRVYPPTPPDDWAERSAPFTEHLEWLFGADTSAFLDWLAHLAQRPGELPTFGFLHIAPEQGLGRGWIAEVLSQVFGGRHVEKGFDLVGALKSGFNGQLGGKLMAVVDEIDAGGAQWSIAQSLKKIVTETTRLVNAKYGRVTLEHNACRWLIFSNSETALPLEGGDRRFHVARCDDPPKAKDYYAQLYALRNDLQFIASVAELLRQRDISTFRPSALR